MNYIYLIWICSLSVVFILFFIFILFYSNKIHFVKIKGTQIYKINLYSQQVVSLTKNKIQKDIFGFNKRKYKNKILIKDLLNFFNKSEKITQQIKNTINDINIFGNKKELIFEYTIKKIKKHFLNFKFIFIPLNNSSNNKYKKNYILIIKWKKWKKNEIEKNVKNEKRPQKIQDLYKSKLKYRGFIALNLNHQTNNVKSQILKKIIFFYKINYFINANVLIFVINDNYFKILKWKINFFINKLNKLIRKLKIHEFEGSCFLIKKNTLNLKYLIKALNTINYLILLSIKFNKNFISTKDSNFEVKNYKIYCQNIEKFNIAIKTKNIISKYISIKDISEKKEILQFVYPGILNINKQIFDFLLKNQNNYHKLINCHLENTLIKKNIEKSLLINANWEYLKDKENEIQNNNFFYVLNIENLDSDYEFKKIKNQIPKNNINLSLKINYFNTNVLFILKLINPKFIILSQKFLKKANINFSNFLSDLLIIKNFAENTKSKIIFEKFPIFLDNEKLQMFNLHYFFEHKINK